MILVPQHDFITCFESQPIVDRIVGFARIADERNLVTAHAEVLRDLPPRRFEQVGKLCAILERAVHIDVARQLCYLFGDDARGGAHIGRIHRHLVLAECELAAHHLPVVLATSRRGRQERRKLDDRSSRKHNRTGQQWQLPQKAATRCGFNHGAHSSLI